jgi:hypothetical protein
MKSDLSKTTFGEANECEICRGATSYSKKNQPLLRQTHAAAAK